MELKGNIHSFESMGAVDGPGIRFIVFMQGCKLNCKYCQNRDTWSLETNKEYTVNEIIEKALRTKPYMDSTGGGVTISGGEPLLQAPFLLELFKKLKELNISTCIDTSGSIIIDETIKELLNYTDLVLLDIKHIDENKCIRLTGFSNKKELDFAKYCSENNIKMWIRQVLVPGFTDDIEDLKTTRKFIDSLKTVEKVEVLPYHDLGKQKWLKLGIAYPLENVRKPTNEEVKRARLILEQ